MYIDLYFFITFVWLFFTIASYYTFKSYEKRKGVRISTQNEIANILLFITFLFLPAIFIETILTSPTTNFDIQNNTLQFLGTFISIFFTLSILPAERIIGKTTHHIVKRIIQNKIYTKILLNLLLIFLLILIQINFGVSKTINFFHTGFAIIGIFSFVLLINESFRLLDVREVIKDYEEDIIFLYREKISKIVAKYNDPQKQWQEMLQIKNLLITETKKFIEPIFTKTRKFMAEDHEEVAQKGLDSLANITIEYINSYSFSIKDHDQFLIYMIERFEDLKLKIKDDSYHLTSYYLLESLARISSKSMEIKTPQSTSRSTYLTHSLVNSVKNMVLSKEMQKPNSLVPLSGVRFLFEIAQKALHVNNPNGFDFCLKALVEISEICTPIKHNFTITVATDANKRIMQLNLYLIYNDLSFSVQELIEAQRKILEAFIETGENNPRKTHLDPLIGTGMSLHSVFDPFDMESYPTIATIAFYLFNDQKLNLKALWYIETETKMLEQVVVSAANKKMFHIIKEISSSCRDILFHLSSYMWVYDLNVNRHTSNINNSAYKIFERSFEAALDDRNTLILEEVLEDWISSIGFNLIISSGWNSFCRKSIKFILDTYKQQKSQLHITHEGKLYTNPAVQNKLESIREWLGLCLYWSSNLVFDQEIFEEIYLTLEDQVQSLNDLLPKSVDSIGDLWWLNQPFSPSYSRGLDEFRLLLNVTNTGISELRKEVLKLKQKSYTNLLSTLIRIKNI